jgi:hypothetical protein
MNKIFTSGVNTAWGGSKDYEQQSGL